MFVAGRTMKKFLVKAVDFAYQKVSRLRILVYRRVGFVSFKGESFKARARRSKEGFFDKFCTGNGLDIGFGGDPICSEVDGWDFCNGDAQFLQGVPDQKYDFVYSSHCLEHMGNPYVALRSWWRVVKVGGYLILYIPHRDLYEKRTELPSRWNMDHKWYFLPENDELPDTLGLRSVISKSISGFELAYLKVCNEGHSIADPSLHSNGEYSIEAVLRKVAK